MSFRFRVLVFSLPINFKTKGNFKTNKTFIWKKFSRAELPESDTFFVLISRVATLIPYTKKVLILIRVVWYVSFWYWYDTFPKTILWYLCSFFWYLWHKTELDTIPLFFCCYFFCWFDTALFFVVTLDRIFLVICLFPELVSFFCWHGTWQRLSRKDFIFCQRSTWHTHFFWKLPIVFWT